MRSPNKNRSRNKNNRKSVGNVVNRVFESAGPEGKVRGTPQQIIEKYQTLARDATLSGDPVASEGFLQHAEHYVRMLAEAQAQLEAQQARRREQNQQQGHQCNGQDAYGEQPAPVNGSGKQPQPSRNARSSVPEAASEGGQGLLETPENSPRPRRRRRSSSNPSQQPQAEAAPSEAAAAVAEAPSPSE